MGGRNKQAEQISQQNASFQQDIAKHNQALADENSKLRGQYQKPFIDFNTKIASGDRNSMLTASAVPLSNLDKQYNQSKSTVYDTVAPGIGREAALTQAAMQHGDSTAGYLNDAYTKSLQNLYGAGTEAGDTGLQQTGAAYRGYEGSNQAAQQLQQNATQRKAATMGAFGSLANLAGGGIFGALAGGKSGGGAAPASYGANFGAVNNIASGARRTPWQDAGSMFSGMPSSGANFG